MKRRPTDSALISWILSFLISTLFSFMPVCMQLFSDIDAVCRNGFLSLCITLLMEN